MHPYGSFMLITPNFKLLYNIYIFILIYVILHRPKKIDLTFVCDEYEITIYELLSIDIKNNFRHDKLAGSYCCNI